MIYEECQVYLALVGSRSRSSATGTMRLEKEPRCVRQPTVCPRSIGRGEVTRRRDESEQAHCSFVVTSGRSGIVPFSSHWEGS